MADDPWDYDGDSYPDPDAPITLGHFRGIVIVITFILNGTLFMLSIDDVYGNQHGMPNAGAMINGFFWSPILNFVFIILFLIIGSLVRAGNRPQPYTTVAIVAPLVGALINLVTVFAIVPWHGSRHLIGPIGYRIPSEFRCRT